MVYALPWEPAQSLRGGRYNENMTILFGNFLLTPLQLRIQGHPLKLLWAPLYWSLLPVSSYLVVRPEEASLMRPSQSFQSSIIDSWVIAVELGTNAMTESRVYS